MKFQYQRLEAGASLPRPGSCSPFKAIVVVEDEVDPEWQAETSRWLTESGCLYMMVWGKDSNSWDDSIDFANLNRFGYAEVPDENLIMTTWHANEPLKEVLWFAKHSAVHPTVKIKHVMLLHIGSNDREKEFEDLFRHT